MSPSILQVRDVKKSFGEFEALRGVNMDIMRGDVVGLIGPNGSGKSTTFNVISGMLKQDDGTIQLYNENISNLPPHEINRLGLARTFQHTRLWRELTVIENLLLPAKNHVGNALINVYFRPNEVMNFEQEMIEKAVQILEFLEVDHMINKYCAELSGGQSKLVDIGRILMNDPKILLLDEPAAGVAPPLAEKIFEYIQKLNKELDITVVIVEHNMDFILRTEIDNIFVMSSGQIIAEGNPDEIQDMKKVQEAYLGV